jgi:hypothetical protein
LKISTSSDASEPETVDLSLRAELRVAQFFSSDHFIDFKLEPQFFRRSKLQHQPLVDLRVIFLLRYERFDLDDFLLLFFPVNFDSIAQLHTLICPSKSEIKQ